jgi:O-antigen ligase
MRVIALSIYPYLCFALFFTLPFDDYFRALPNLLLIALAALFPFVLDTNQFKSILRSHWTWVLVFLGFVVIQSWALGRFDQDFVIIQKMLLAGALSLLLYPVRDNRTLMHGVIYSSVAAVLYSMVRLVILLNQGASFGFLESAHIIEALLMDRIYLGLLSVLSIIFSYKLLRKEFDPNNGYYLANIILQAAFILFLVSRIAIVVLLLSFVLSLWYRQKRGPQLLFFGGSIALIVALAFVLSNDLRKQFFYNNNPEHQEGLLANTMALEPRMVIWDCALDIAQQQSVVLTGNGFTQTNKDMLTCYKSDIDNPVKKAWFLTKKYNVHNQFLDLYLGSGLLALLLFVGGLLVSFIRQRKSLYPTALLMATVIFLMAENMFHRQIGAYYMGLIWALLMFLPQDNQAEKPEKQD